jgi:hypothetical protein
VIEPTQEDVGRQVIYTSKGGDVRERGRITGYNAAFVFVRYGEMVKATSRHDLAWFQAASCAVPSDAP